MQRVRIRTAAAPLGAVRTQFHRGRRNSSALAVVPTYTRAHPTCIYLWSVKPTWRWPSHLATSAWLPFVDPRSAWPPGHASHQEHISPSSSVAAAAAAACRPPLAPFSRRTLSAPLAEHLDWGNGKRGPSAACCSVLPHSAMPRHYCHKGYSLDRPQERRGPQHAAALLSTGLAGLGFCLLWVYITVCIDNRPRFPSLLFLKARLSAGRAARSAAAPLCSLAVLPRHPPCLTDLLTIRDGCCAQLKAVCDQPPPAGAMGM